MKVTPLINQVAPVCDGGGALCSVCYVCARVFMHPRKGNGYSHTFPRTIGSPPLWTIEIHWRRKGLLDGREEHVL